MAWLLVLWFFAVIVGTLVAQRIFDPIERHHGLDSFPVAPPEPTLPCPARHPHRRNRYCNGDGGPTDFDG